MFITGQKAAESTDPQLRGRGVKATSARGMQSHVQTLNPPMDAALQTCKRL